MQLLNGSLDLLYPPKCNICKNSHKSRIPGDFVCSQCRKTIQFNRPPFCLCCSRHLGTSCVHPRCSNCRRFKPAYDLAWGACLYTDSLKTLIHLYKYHQKTYLRRLFVNLMTEFINKYSFDVGQFDCLVPIPLHPTRYRERGFNQAELLAKGLAQFYNIDIYSNLIRSKNTQHQALLSKKDRWTNTCEAFTIKLPLKIRDKSVLLIDDLLTSGATASAASAALRRIGVKRIGVLTLAITTSSIDSSEKIEQAINNPEYLLS